MNFTLHGHFTEAQSKAKLTAIGAPDAELPRKGRALYLSFPLPAVSYRITKAPPAKPADYNKSVMYVWEYVS